MYNLLAMERGMTTNVNAAPKSTYNSWHSDCSWSESHSHSQHIGCYKIKIEQSRFQTRYFVLKKNQYLHYNLDRSMWSPNSSHMGIMLRSGDA